MPKYLHLKRDGIWHLNKRVPTALVGKPRHGSGPWPALIQESLRTKDEREAERRSWDRLRHWQREFERALHGDGYDDEEVERLARDAMASLAKKLRRVEPDPYFIETAGNSGDPVAEQLGEMLNDSLHDLQAGDFDRVEAEFRRVMKESGATLDGDTEHALKKALLRGQIAAIEGVFASRTGEAPPVVGPLHTGRKATTNVAPRRGSGMPFSEAAKQFVAHKMADRVTGWSKQTEAQNRATFRLFADFTGDPPIDAVTRDDGVRFRDTVAKLHPNWGRGATAKGLSLDELLDRFSMPNGENGLSVKTLKRYMSALHGLYDWLIDQGLIEGTNPFHKLVGGKGLKSRMHKARTRYLPFEPDELATLFHAQLMIDSSFDERVRPKRHDANTSLQWLPIVSLFTGMRAGEIAQLQVGDVAEENGVRFFHVREDDEEQRVKTADSFRRIPIHPTLTACGFDEYVHHVRAQGHEWLWPGLKPGGPDGKRSWYFSKKFGTHRRKLGIVRPRKAFHSFRASVATALERASVPESEAVQVLGHDRMSMTYGHYSGGLTLMDLSRIVERIDYPGLDLSHLHQPE